MNRNRSPGTLVGAAVSTFGTNAAAAASQLLNVLIVARALGPTGRGEVAFIIAVWVLMAGLATFGLEEANANFGATRPGRRGSLLANSMVAAIGFGLLAATLVGSLMTLVPPARGEVELQLLLIALVTLPSGLLQQYLKYLLQSDYRFGVTNVAWVASPASTVVINGALALTGHLSVEAVIGVFVATNVLSTLILLGSAVRHFGIGRPDLALAREMVSFGLKTHLSRFMGLATYRADQWLLGAIAGPFELGLYSIALSLAEVLFYIPGVIVLVQRPHLVRAGPSQAAEFAARIFRRAAVLSTAAAVGVFLTAPIAILTLFGDEFRGSVDDLRLLAFAALGIVALDLFANTIIAQRRPLLASAGTAVALSVAVLLNVILAPGLGGAGAAIAKSAAFTAGGAAMAVIFLRMFKGDPLVLVPRLDDVAWYRRKLRSGFALAKRRL